MNKAEYYKNLNLAEIEIVAHGWGRKYPTVKKIYLYRVIRPLNKYEIIVESFNSTELNQIAESLSYESFRIYVKESPDHLPFFFQAVKKEIYGVDEKTSDDNVPLEFKQKFLKYAHDKFIEEWRTSIQHEFKKDLDAACTPRSVNPIWIFHLEIPGQELPGGVNQNSEEIYQDSHLLIYERENDHRPANIIESNTDIKNVQEKDEVVISPEGLLGKDADEDDKANEFFSEQPIYDQDYIEGIGGEIERKKMKREVPSDPQERMEL